MLLQCISQREWPVNVIAVTQRSFEVSEIKNQEKKQMPKKQL